MESVQPYQRYIGARFTAALRHLMHEAYEGERFLHSDSVRTYANCFDNLHLLPTHKPHAKMCPEDLARMFHAQSGLLGRVISRWQIKRQKRRESLAHPPALATYIEFIRHGTSKIDCELGRFAFENAATPLSDPQKKLVRFEIGSHLPGLLLDAIGATLGCELEAHVTAKGLDKENAYEAFDNLVQEACQQVQLGRMHPRHQGDSLRDLFEVSMNALVKEYHPPPRFLQYALPRIYFWRKGDTDLSYYREGRSTEVRDFYFELGAELGYTQQDILSAYQDRKYAETVRALQRLKNNQRSTFEQQRLSLGTQVMRMRLARRLVDNLASGQIMYSHVVRLGHQFIARPLASAKIAAREPVRSHHSSWRQVSIDTTSSPEDNERIAKLEKFTQGWANARIFHSEEIDLGAKYFVAVFPEILPSGALIEHAIADHPAKGHHAIYGWRGENGLTANGEMTLTWKDIFSLPGRAAIRAIGATRIYHNEGYEMKVEEFLTDPPEEVIRKNMQKWRS